MTPLTPSTVKPVEEQPVVKPVTPEKTPVNPLSQTPCATKQPAKSTASSQGSNIMSAPAGSYTLQLSSASRSDTLEAFAKENKLANYKVYKTYVGKLGMFLFTKL